MQRSSIIATVIAAGGVLIAGSVASVAVINAASSSEVQASNLDLVADDGSAPSSPAAVAPAASDATVAPVDLPSLEASALPELPEVADASQAAAPAAPAQQTTKTAKTQQAAKPASEPSQSADPGVSSDQARSIVMKQGDGVKTLAVSKDTRSGYRTWAVRIERSNGEVITGYVDRESGVVVDWVVNAKPAATTSSSGSSNGSDDSSTSGGDDSSHSGGSDDSSSSGSDDSSHSGGDDSSSSGSDHDSDDD